MADQYINHSYIQHLIPHLSILKHNLENIADTPEKIDHNRLILEQLPYSLGASYNAVIRLSHTANEITRKIELIHNHNEIILGINSVERDILSYIVDSFLDVARHAQNALLPFISKSLSISLPQSLNDFIKKIEKHKKALPETIYQEIYDYWKKHGQRLKDYRDLGQHHSVVSSDLRAVIGVDGRACIYFVLPNNPESKNMQPLSYENPVVHAIPYILDEFFALATTVYRVTNVLLEPSVNRNLRVEGVFFKGPLHIGENEPMPVCQIPSVDEIHEKIKSFHSEVASKS